MNADEIMTRNPVAVAPSTTIGEAVDLMLDKGFRHLPVLEGDQLVGMVSDRDLREVAYGSALASGDLDAFQEQSARPVSEVMSGGVVSIHPANTVAEIAQVMLEEGVGALPVVEIGSDTLVGMVSYVDVLRQVAASQ